MTTAGLFSAGGYALTTIGSGDCALVLPSASCVAVIFSPTFSARVNGTSVSASCGLAMPTCSVTWAKTLTMACGRYPETWTALVHPPTCGTSRGDQSFSLSIQECL